MVSMAECDDAQFMIIRSGVQLSLEQTIFYNFFNHGRAVLLAIAEILVYSLHLACNDCIVYVVILRHYNGWVLCNRIMNVVMKFLRKHSS